MSSLFPAVGLPSPAARWAIHLSRRFGKGAFKRRRSLRHGFVAMTFPSIRAVFSVIINSFYVTYASKRQGIVWNCLC